MSLDSSLPETEAASALSRRGLIRNAAGAGAVGLAAGVLLSSGTAAAAPAEAGHAAALAPEPAEDRTATGEPLIVHLPDAESGVLDIYHGERHSRVQNGELADALRNAAR
ncbi:hypothetical protein GXW83_16000 [Streptacidiphilus sp. PB12-B1b]|uniref:hypothetical protein n=1 Tax=Streptacidiphilus sp. PB12-B1b TaxID=2705012 RepID=UPI0015FBE31D|nr:hypothetical protein [Streptacidiphilus sp. PB12-B1b]QMU76982.1 hypothetical protein GXW83_16000 [Streptacidiphilus sp. PB12-B1b]